MSSFAIVAINHDGDCEGCLESAVNARAMARTSGAVRSSHSDGRGHGATVERGEDVLPERSNEGFTLLKGATQ